MTAAGHVAANCAAPWTSTSIITCRPPASTFATADFSVP